MAPTLFYLADIPAPGEVAVLDGPEGHHAATVRRIRVGESITLSDGAGVLAPAQVVAAAKDRLELLVRERFSTPRAKPPVTVVQALPKADRSELAVELMTEAGVDEIVPWQAARCVANWDRKQERGRRKWQDAARAAAGQSRRAYIPPVASLADTGEVVRLVDQTVAGGGHALALHESGTTGLTDLSWDAVNTVLLIVGPEGGIDEAEVSAFEAAGATPVVLGQTILRTSTAAAVALGALGVLTCRW